MIGPSLTGLPGLYQMSVVVEPELEGYDDPEME